MEGQLEEENAGNRGGSAKPFLGVDSSVVGCKNILFFSCE